MSKINQIANKLLELGSGEFEKLANSYLAKKEYKLITAIGSVAGSNKTRKGTPDALFEHSNKKYVLAEYTAQEKNVFQKLSGDIAKCLDESKTGIPIKKIEEIVLCYNSDLSAREINQLSEKCSSVGVNFKSFGLSAISLDLYKRYPDITKDYLNIEIDTGQIISLDRFIELNEKKRISTTLNTTFHFREDEKKKIIQAIQEKNLVLISGQAGVGKTRIAIECYREFIEKNLSYKPYCIYNKDVGLYEDIKRYFSDSKDYLIFVDDANRISGFQFILQLLQEKRSDQNFKIIVTVRDYALNQISRKCQDFEDFAKIELARLTDTEIQEFIKKEFEITNYFYLERIKKIAKGNLRIAVMAAKVAEEKNQLNSINDVSELYEKYFESIKMDLIELDKENVLKVAGIVVFFRSVDKNNNDVMQIIKDIFGIATEDFWRTARELHNKEIFDMYGNEIVKISDQVLATYLFYLVFFKEKQLDFSSLLTSDFFPCFKSHLVDAIKPIMDIFNTIKIKTVIQPAVDEVWEKMQEKDEEVFFQLLQMFCLAKPTESLNFIKKKIDTLANDKLNIDKVSFKKDSGVDFYENNPNLNLHNFITILPSFKRLNEDRLKISLDLFFQYAKKQPSKTPHILACLTDNYGFIPESIRWNYVVENTVIDKILEFCKAGKNKYFTRIFIALAEYYLQTHFESFDPISERDRTTTLRRFNLQETNQLFDLREKILTNIFSFYKIKYFQNHILKLLLCYSSFNAHKLSSNIAKKDSKFILDFFKKNLDSTNFYHCVIVQEYLHFLERFDIPIEEKLKKQFYSKTYELYENWGNNYTLQNKLGLDYDGFKKYKNNKIADLTKSYSKKNYEELFNKFFNLQKIYDNSKKQINNGILIVLEALAKRDKKLFCEVIKNHLKKKNLELNASSTIHNLIASCGAKETLNIITTANFPRKKHWIFNYYQCLPKDDIQQKQIKALLKRYKILDYEYLDSFLDFLLNYDAVQKGVTVEVIQKIVERAKVDPRFANIITNVFNSFTEINKKLFSEFPANSKLLEDAYLAVDRIGQNTDYDVKILSKLSDSNPNFIDRYLANKFSQKNFISYPDDSHNYSAFWLHKDYLNIMQRITKVVFQYKEKTLPSAYYTVFFNPRESQTDKTILTRQDKFLLSEISKKNTDKDFMILLFSVIAEFKSERRINFYKKFLELNKNFDDFENLRFLPTLKAEVFSGSKEPLLQEKVDFYEKIVSLCDSTELLEHKEWIEKIIKDKNSEIELWRKTDFTEELWPYTKKLYF